MVAEPAYPISDVFVHRFEMFIVTGAHAPRMEASRANSPVGGLVHGSLALRSAPVNPLAPHLMITISV